MVPSVVYTEMATKNTRACKDTQTPTDLFSEKSVLSLDEYHAMQTAISEQTRFDIVYELVYTNEMSPTQLGEVLDIKDCTLHYHLDELLDVGFIEKHTRLERDSRGLNTYYRATVLGEVILEHGAKELLRRE
jgi:ArsR family transcriptional regulator, arsenate/arsenite/antimonite-responsive transcriptional repressor